MPAILPPLAAAPPDAAELAHFRSQGYLIRRGLFPAAEIAALAEHFMALHTNPPRAFYDPPPRRGPDDDPLVLYPRIMHPHRFDPLARRYLLDPRIVVTLRALLGDEPLAAQSMFYFKPPGARGQALHQDNFYLKVAPGSCLAAWVAVDRCDADNGGLMVVPQTQHLPLQCPAQADMTQSFFRDFVEPPPGAAPVPADMEPGDTLFFNGSVIHGSGPNRSRDRFRRAFICHYLPAGAHEISEWYFPLVAADGSEIGRQPAVGGGPCGTPAVGIEG